MPNYSYTAISDTGKQFKGMMNANNIDDLEYKIREIGLELISGKIAKKGSFSLSFSKPIATKDIILLCTHFAQLDKAGVPVTESIEDLRDSGENPRFRDLMQDIYEAVKGGKMLSEAMAHYPKIFDDVFVGLIGAGEKTGNLYLSFEYLAEHLKWSEEIKRKTQKAIRYPLFLLTVLFAMVTIMMVFVIPKLSEFLIKQDFALPGYTKALIGMSGLFQSYWYLMITIPILLYITHKVFYKTNERYAYIIDSLLLMTPYLGKTILKIDVARFSQFFLITFKSGIDVIECFDIVSRVVHNRVVKSSINEISQDVSDGNSISNALQATELFPNLVVRMFQIGENTGNMSESLENVKYFYDREVSDAVGVMVGIIQPALTLIMGGLLLWIAVAVFGPLYSSFGNIG